MLYSEKTLKGYGIQARDGQMGKLDEFYFDDGNWWIRYLVINTGGWLNRQRVILIPESVSWVNTNTGSIEVSLTKKEVEESPDALEVTPVSREHEISLHRHYDWTPYWQVDPVATTGYGRVPGPIVRPSSEYVKANVDVANDATAFADAKVQDRASGVDANAEANEALAVELHPSGRIQSSRDVGGYHIQALDGEIGHLDDFLIDPNFQRIDYLVVDTRNWMPGKKVVIPPGFVQSIQCDNSQIHVALTKEQIQKAPEYEVENGVLIKDDAEMQLRQYYARKILYK